MMYIHNAKIFLSFTAFLLVAFNVDATESFCPNGSNPDPNVLWCDSFEDSDLETGASPANYIDFNDDGGKFARSGLDSFDGNFSLRQHWDAGDTGNGSVMWGFGRNPVDSRHYTNQDFDEIYWRFYIKLESGFTGSPNKLTRAFIFAKSDWSQAMIGHIWDGPPFELDPATGINASSALVTSGWNDAANLAYLGKTVGKTTMSPGDWYCVEAHVKLNTPGVSDGVFEYWIDDTSEASQSNLNWRNSWTDYGINTIMFSNYWNTNSPANQDRFLDSFVVSKQRIGCANTIIAKPKPPSNVSAQ